MRNLSNQTISKKELMSITSIQNLASKTGIRENTISSFVSELSNNGEMNQKNLVNRISEYLEMFYV